jgi:hypothetical protein
MSVRCRLARLGTVAAGLLALVGGTTPPAHADTVMVTAFTGTMTLVTPLGYPCMGTAPVGGTPTVDLGLCPVIGKTVTIDNSLSLTVTVNGTTITTPQLQPKIKHLSNNTATVASLSSSTCATADINVLKGVKPLAHINTGCGFTLISGSLPNTVSGSCGLSSGQYTETFNDGLGQIDVWDIHFIEVDGFVLYDGHSTKMGGINTLGLIKGFGQAIPPLPGSLGDGTSCLTKTAKTFTLLGTLVGVGTQ